VHLVTFVGLALLVNGARLGHLRVEGEYPLAKVPFELTMTHAWFWFLKPGGWNYPSWSISAEWFAYLFIFPLSAWVLRRQGKATSLLLGGYATLLAWLVLLTIGIDERGISRVSCEFFAGAMTFAAFQQSAGFTKWCQGRATSLALAVLAIAALAPAGSFVPVWLLVLLFPLMLVGFTTEKSLVGRFLATPVVVWGGRISYSLYMTHALVQKFLKVALPEARFVSSPFPVRCAILLVEVVLLIGAAAFLYHFVEEPARHWIRRLGIKVSGRGRALPQVGTIG
jgi:peptidoglycan/LPS O-acetylase OafA/YrhL